MNLFTKEESFKHEKNFTCVVGSVLITVVIGPSMIPSTTLEDRFVSVKTMTEQKEEFFVSQIRYYLF